MEEFVENFYSFEYSSNLTTFNHSNKKRKDSLETRAELAVLRIYVENQAILEPILLYQASNANKTKRRAARTVYELIFFTFL